METIAINKESLIKQLRFDLDMIHIFEGHIREETESLAENSNFGMVDLNLQSLRWNQHCKDMYRHRIVAVLELIGVFDEDRGDTSDIDMLKQKVDKLESA